jgi:HK97 gp10 family phage protein
MAATTIKVTGLSNLQALLDTLPPKLELNVMRGALRAGGKLIMQEAVANVPVGPTSSGNADKYGGYAGALRDSIHLGTKISRPYVMARVVVGGKTKTGADVWYAHIIEFTGAVPHTISAKGNAALSIGGLLFQSVHHPGMKAHPFLRPALDSQGQAAVIASAEYMKTRLAKKEGLDTAEILIAGEDE